MSYRKRNAPSPYEDLAIVLYSSLVSIGYKPTAQFSATRTKYWLSFIHTELALHAM